jgi:hypothetical protein
MKILERETQFGMYSVLIQLDDGNSMRLQFPTVIPDADVLIEAQKTADINNEIQSYNAIENFQFNIIDNVELLKEFIQKIKENPNVTFNQYNTWLETKTWYEEAIIKYFVFTLATNLANRKGIELSDLTETKVLQKLRDWIVTTNLRTIEKVIGYGTPNI